MDTANREIENAVAAMTDDELRHAANRASFTEAATAELKRRQTLAQPTERAEQVWNGYSWVDKNPADVSKPAAGPFDTRTEISADAYHIAKCCSRGLN